MNTQDRLSKGRKIALVANSTWNIYNFRLNLIQYLEDHNCEVVVIAPVDEYIRYLNKAHKIKHIPLKGLKRKGKNPFHDIRLTLNLARIYHKEKPDAIIHYTIKPNIYGNLAAKWCNIPSICVVTGLGYTFLHQGISNKISNWLYKLSFRYSQKVAFENSDDKDLFIEMDLASAEKCAVINGCGIDTNFFKPEKKKSVFARKFLFIGRLLYDKGIVEFVQAAKEVRAIYPEVEFQVLGELDAGNPSALDKDRLLKWVDNKVINYLGTTPDVRTYIQKADVIVLTSYREGLSKVLMEGLAMGKPIITTDTPGCRQTVDHGRNGYLVPVKSVDAVVKACKDLINMTAIDLEIMGQLSRKKAIEVYDDSLVVKKYGEILEEIGIGLSPLLNEVPKVISK